MKPEQLKWTDEQWAAHLGCAVQEIPSIKKYVTENFFPAIAKNPQTGKYFFIAHKKHTAMSGTEYPILWLSSDKEFSTSGKATKYANQNIIPKLEFNKFWSWALDVPQRALQMLHIKER